MDREKLIKVLRYDEGDVLTIYKDSLGYFTIGVGHLLTKNPSMREAIDILDEQVGRLTGGHIIELESTRLLDKDIDIVLEGIQKSKILKEVYDGLSDTRKIGLISMCFQMGISGTEGFSNSLNFIKNGQWDKAERNLQLSKWYKQTRNRAQRVINIICKEDLRPYGYYF